MVDNLEKQARKALALVETPAGLITTIFMVAVFLYSTFATSGGLERVDSRVTRSNEFQNVEREKVRQDLKEAVTKLENSIDKTNDSVKDTNKILTEILIESRKH